MKYNSAIDIYDDMTRALPRKRPNCEEILEKKDLWALNKEEFEINDEEIISKLDDKTQSIFLFFKSKLRI
jgi:hypothetical protein